MSSPNLGGFDTQYGVIYKVLDSTAYVFIFATAWALAEAIRHDMLERFAEYGKLGAGLIAVMILMALSVIVVCIAYNLFTSPALNELRVVSEDEHMNKYMDAKLTRWLITHQT